MRNGGTVIGDRGSGNPNFVGSELPRLGKMGTSFRDLVVPSRFACSISSRLGRVIFGRMRDQHAGFENLLKVKIYPKFPCSHATIVPMLPMESTSASERRYMNEVTRMRPNLIVEHKSHPQ